MLVQPGHLLTRYGGGGPPAPPGVVFNDPSTAINGFYNEHDDNAGNNINPGSCAANGTATTFTGEYVQAVDAAFRVDVNSSGTVTLSKTYTHASDEAVGRRIIKAASDVWIAANVDGGAKPWLIRTASDGTFTSCAELFNSTGASCNPIDMALLSTGKLAIAHRYQGTTYDEACLTVMNADNTFHAARTIEFSADSGAYGVCEDSTGNIYLCGFDGSGNGFITKFNSSFTHQWTKTYAALPSIVSIKAFGSALLVCGITSGNFYAARISQSDGSVLSSKTYAHDTLTGFMLINLDGAVTSDGSWHFGGDFSDGTNADRDSVLIGTYPDLTLKFARLHVGNTSNRDMVTGLCVTSDDNLAGCGDYYGASDRKAEHFAVNWDGTIAGASNWSDISANITEAVLSASAASSSPTVSNRTWTPSAVSLTAADITLNATDVK